MRWVKLVGLAVSAEVALFAVAVLSVLFYSTWIHPGERPGFYETQALVIVPWVAMAVSFPLFYWMSRWCGPWPSALVFWGLHEVLDVTISVATDGIKGLKAIALFWTISQVAKFVGCWLGGHRDSKPKAS